LPLDLCWQLLLSLFVQNNFVYAVELVPCFGVVTSSSQACRLAAIFARISLGISLSRNVGHRSFAERSWFATPCGAPLSRDGGTIFSEAALNRFRPIMVLYGLSGSALLAARSLFAALAFPDCTEQV
jgi:hypothetical protein